MHKTILFATALMVALPAIAQMAVPGKADLARVTGGSYKVDSYHTQVAWSLNHLGFNVFYGLFGNATGTLTLDPAKPSAASLSIDIPVDNVVTTSPALTGHLKTPDFFDAAKYPVATFRSTSVAVRGTNAKIAGNLTIRGVTKPVVLDARFTGAGTNPRNQKAHVGFEATATIKRSDFGIVFGLPAVADQVDLRITAAFERVS